MFNPWFRLYAEFEDDPKVQTMPEEMQRRLIMLFCAKCKGRRFNERHVTFQWRVTMSQLAETKALFMENGFVDEHWELLNWNKRQFTSDSSTERTRRYRERKRTSPESHGDGRDANSDAIEQNRTEQNKNRKKKEAPASPALPDFVKPESWEKFVAMRKKIRAPLEAGGVEIALRKLTKLHSQGHDVNAILEESAFRCWRGFFPEKESGTGSNGKASRPNDAHMSGGSQDWTLDDCRKYREQKARDGKPIPKDVELYMQAIESKGKGESR